MKTTKLVVGILQIVIAVFITFQACIVGIGKISGNSITHLSGGSAGLLCAILYLATGIVYICTHNKKKMAGDIACLIMMLIAWFVSIVNASTFSDLALWGWLAFIIGIGFFVWHLILNRRKIN
ncbi:hypothetical protein FP435_04415 [Lactobacillus sp. PV037]|uniref:hypothetical protein n=1 Tax=Lactobacillus sp. PV037 TaxID=2594496 RepID=UPI002240A366|nr:hypothetical protein [Lactobacillus sp. PV037]QNQ83738.1 hypothetical protein FP435_04415 [Lactobacillus sp. PV037]